MQTLRKVNEYIQKKQLLTNGQKVIVGLSGGADSMALLHILSRLGYKCIAAHCNFQLRGEESNRDELFTQQYCHENAIEYHKILFDTFAYMDSMGVSLEMAARDLRYQWFDKLSKELNTESIAVAHHQDDSVETILINITRGCGLRGLTGIPAKNNKIVRPLLCLSRQEIIEYLTFHNTPFITDSTNKQDIYIRNKIRLNVLPILQEINPSVKESIYNMGQYLSDVKDIYGTYISEAIQNIFNNNILDIEKLKQYQGIPSILFEILNPYGFNSDAIRTIYNSMDSISGKVFYSEHYRLIKDRNRFILEPLNNIEDSFDQVYLIDENESGIDSPVKLSIQQLTEDENLKIEKNKNCIFLDKASITYPLAVRKWKHGDWFKPFGMNGKKKISDYFTDNKFDLSRKEKTWLLCTAKDEIIWIIGERADNRFRVKDSSADVVKIELQHN